MPQFELDTDGAPRLARGRSPQDAARRALGLAPDARLELGEPEAGTQWAELRVDGVPAGRIRPRGRMRFRRD